MLDSFVSRVNTDASRSCSAPYFFFLLVSVGVEVADTCQRFAKVANLVRLDPASFFQQRLAETRPVISVWRSESNASDDDSLVVRQFGGAIGSDHRTEMGKR